MDAHDKEADVGSSSDRWKSWKQSVDKLQWKWTTSAAALEMAQHCECAKTQDFNAEGAISCPTLYKSLCDRGRSFLQRNEESAGEVPPGIDIIAKDLPRTVPRLDSEAERNRLENILLAYAVHNPKIGYFQPMSCIASHLIVVAGPNEPEVDVFRIFACIMDHYGFKEFCCDGLPMTESYCSQCKDIVKKELPTLHDHLVSINADFFTGEPFKWFQTLFLLLFPRSIVEKIWDAMFRTGPRGDGGFTDALHLAYLVLQFFQPDLMMGDDLEGQRQCFDDIRCSVEHDTLYKDSMRLVSHWANTTASRANASHSAPFRSELYIGQSELYMESDNARCSLYKFSNFKDEFVNAQVIVKKDFVCDSRSEYTLKRGMVGYVYRVDEDEDIYVRFSSDWWAPQCIKRRNFDKLRVKASIRKVTFRPGVMGIDVSRDGTGRVAAIQPQRGRQAHLQNIQVGMRFHTIDDEEYSEDLLDQKIAGSKEYEVVFIQPKFVGWWFLGD